MDIGKEALERFFLDLDGMMVNDKNRYVKCLEDFFEKLSFRVTVFNQIKKQADIYLSTDFNPFDFTPPDENELSDILREILSPEGRHGQADTFLNEFLKLLKNKGLDLEPTGKVTVEREHTTENKRRIDLFLKFEDRTVIGIENKPRAKEQIRQVGDYVDYLEVAFPDKFVFVYIHGTGEQPTSIEADKLEDLQNKNRFFTFSYNSDFCLWLNNCYEKCKSQKVRFFLLDFINYVEKNYMEVVGNE